MKRNHYKIIVYIALALLIAIPMIGLSSWVVINDFLVKPKYNPNSAFYIYLQNQSVTYNYKEQMPNLDLFKNQYLDLNKNGDVSDDNVTIMWKYRKDGDTTNNYSSDLAKPTNAGTYYFYFWCNIDEVDEGVAKELAEENDLYPTEVKFTIDKATVTPSEFNVKYDKTDENGVDFFATKQLSPNDFSYKFTYLDKEVAGSLDISSDLVIGTQDYSYTFNPTGTDKDNFNSYKGSVSIRTYATINFRDSREITNMGILFTKYVPKETDLDPLDNPTTSDLEKSELYNNIKSFDRWVDSNGDDCTKLKNITDDIDLYAVYTFKSYTITYVGYDGKNSTNSMTEEWEHSDFGVKELYVPTVENLYFNGWKESEDLVTSLSTPGDYTLTSDFRWIIPRVIDSISYSSTVTFNNLFTNYQITCKDGTRKVPSTKFSISYMENGVYYYGDSTGKDTTGLKACPSSNVVGSTYLAYITINDTDNYILENIDAAGTYVDGDSGYVAFQYKTVVVGSTYYTIEEAINYANSTTCTFRTKGNETTYVETCFTTLDFSNILTGYSSNGVYSLGNSSTLLISYKDDTTHTNGESTDDAGLSNVVYSVLTVPSGITLNVSSNLTVGAYINAVSSNINRTSLIARRGVVINNGIININDSGTINSYGYVKGTGELNLLDTSTAYDFMAIYDFPGGTAAYSVKNTTFPVSAWSCHNIACSTKVSSTAAYKAWYKLTAASMVFWKTCGIVDDSNSVFKWNGTEKTDHLIKKTQGLDLQEIELQHTLLGQKDVIEIYGNYSDNDFEVSISVKVFITIDVNLQPNLDISMPISYMDCYIKEGSNLVLNKMDYLFMPGTKVVVESGSTLTIGSGVDAAMLAKSELVNAGGNTNFVTTEALCDPNVSDSQLIINGTVICNGSIGGMITTSSTTGTLDISKGSSSARYRCLTGNEPTEHNKDSYSSNGLLLDTSTTSSKTLVNKEFENKKYYSTQASDGQYGWFVDNGAGAIIYDTRGGNSIPSTPLQDVGEGYNLADFDIECPTRTHYTFGGWYLEDSYQTKVSEFVDNQWRFKDYYIFESTTLYAKWIPIEYKSTIVYKFYDDNGNEITSGVTNHQSNPIGEYTYTIETEPINLEEAISDIYNFGGWHLNYVNNTFEGNISTLNVTNYLSTVESVAPEYITIYGKFTKSGIVTIKYSKGSDAPNEAVQIDDKKIDLSNITYSHPTTYSTLDSMKNVSKYFIGWTLDGENMSETELIEYIETLEPNSVVELVAKWGTKYTINYVTTTTKSEYYYPGKAISITSLPSLESNTEKLIWFDSSTKDGNPITSISIDAAKVTDGGAVTYYGYVYYLVSITYSTNNYATISMTISNSSFIFDSSISNKVKEATYGKSSNATITYYAEAGTTFSFSAGNVDGGKGAEMTSTSNTLTVSTSSALTVSAQGEQDTGCVTGDTLITLANGSKKMVKDLTATDLLLVFNHETGKYEAMPIIFNDVEPEGIYRIVNLKFSDGTAVKVVYEHGFFDLDENKYVYIREDNMKEFIGHKFYKAEYDGINYIESEVTLIDAYVIEELTTVYSPVTVYHLNYFTEDMLSMPAGIPGLFNIFEFGDNLTYDQEQMQKDIETYGLYTYDDFDEYISYEVYSMFPAPYLKVAVGKGLTTFEDIVDMIYLYLEKHELTK